MIKIRRTRKKEDCMYKKYLSILLLSTCCFAVESLNSSPVKALKCEELLKSCIEEVGYKGCYFPSLKTTDRFPTQYCNMVARKTKDPKRACSAGVAAAKKHGLCDQ